MQQVREVSQGERVSGGKTGGAVRHVKVGEQARGMSEQLGSKQNVGSRGEVWGSRYGTQFYMREAAN